jgi:glycosyltransferase involved in cell wall biosynthesis
MKILFVSMPSVHVIRWVENLKDTAYELYWFDILGRGSLQTLENVHQFTGWQQRKIPYIKGEYFLSKKVPFLYEKIIPYLEITASEALEKIIREVQPDVVHSFEMQSCSYPILKVMNRFPHLKWIYSCWGTDLFYFKNIKRHNSKIKKVLTRVTYLHTDCERDYKIALTLGFKGKYLGVIPGGTGYKLKEYERYKLALSERKVILVKGYEHLFGRGLNIVKALEQLKEITLNYEVAVFGGHQSVIDYVEKNQLKFKVFTRHELSHDELMQLMGRSILYIGNSISDGMPNTVLEAIVMGVFPIQSNPGNATSEIIIDGENGFLIKDPENRQEIKQHISRAIGNLQLLSDANAINSQIAKERLDYDCNKKKVIGLYHNIEKEIF